MGRKTTTEEFIKKSRLKHKDKYDYSKAIYISSKEKICIICPDHGEFWSLPGNHMQGSRCPTCAKISRTEIISDTQMDFITKAINFHGSKYDYSKVKYINSRTKIIIICPIHGEFSQFPYDHIRGHGCSKCQSYSGFNNISNGELFIKKWLHDNNIPYKSQFELITDKIARNSHCINIDFFVKHNNNQYFIEYDGEQHFKFIPFFHNSEEDFNKQQRRDNVLNDFCNLHKDKVTLIRFNYKQNNKEIEESLSNIFLINE